MQCTHVALQVRSIEKSAAFYEALCDMRIVHDRRTDESSVVWLGWGEDPPRFVIVLIERDYEENRQPPWQHIGMAVDARDEVDAIFAKATAMGIENLWPPVDAGEIVGYYCAAPDPDGNVVEFSFGQRIG